MPSGVLRLPLSCNTWLLYVLQGVLGLVSISLLEWNGEGNTGMCGSLHISVGTRSGMERSDMRMPFVLCHRQGSKH